MLRLIPRQDGDEITIPTDSEGVDTFLEVVKALMANQYFWGVVVILVMAAGVGYIWKNYPSVRYAAIFILGMAAGNFFPAIDLFK